MITPERINQVTVTIQVNEGQAYISTYMKTHDCDVAILALATIRDKQIAVSKELNAKEEGGAK